MSVCDGKAIVCQDGQVPHKCCWVTGYIEDAVRLKLSQEFHLAAESLTGRIKDNEIIYGLYYELNG